MPDGYQPRDDRLTHPAQHLGAKAITPSLRMEFSLESRRATFHPAQSYILFNSPASDSSERETDGQTTP